MRVTASSAALIAQFLVALRQPEIERKLTATARLCPALDELSPRKDGRWSACTSAEVLAGFRALLIQHGPAIRASISAEIFAPFVQTIDTIEQALSE